MSKEVSILDFCFCTKPTLNCVQVKSSSVMTELLEGGMKPLLDYVQNISSALFGLSSQDILLLLNQGEETEYAMSKYALDSDVMVIYVEWMRSEGGTGEYRMSKISTAHVCFVLTIKAFAICVSL